MAQFIASGDQSFAVLDSRKSGADAVIGCCISGDVKKEAQLPEDAAAGMEVIFEILDHCCQVTKRKMLAEEKYMNSKR